MSLIRVLLADDHNLVRKGFCSLVEELPGMEVVAEAANGREAVRLMKEHRPDVALMDVKMPELNGLDATALAQVEAPEVAVLILSMYDTEGYVVRALRCGAKGYLLKSVDTAELELAIRTVASGRRYLTPEVSGILIDRVLEDVDSVPSELDRLTLRQREILQLIAEGNTTKHIADKLSITAKTVESHRTNLMSELGLHDVAGLVRFAVRTGVVAPD